MIASAPNAFVPVRRARQPHGAIFVLTLGIILILGALALVFARGMRTETMASANRLAYVEADAIEQGAEKWVQAQVESYPGDSITVTQVPAEALQVGNGYFWVLTPDPTSDQAYAFGITDEAGKLNLNTASATELLQLPGMQQEIADAIHDWRSPPTSPSPDGAESDYYESLPDPYDAKNSAFETVEETLLVRDVTPDLLFGQDLNRDGVVTDAERAASAAGTTFNGIDNLNRGIFNYLTVYSVEPNTAIGGKARINVNSSNTKPLRDYLTTKLSSSRASSVVNIVSALIRAARGGQVFSDLGKFYQVSGMSPDEFSQVADGLTASTSKTLTGMVNVNTAPKEVLMCLPGLEPTDGDALVAYRTGNANSGGYGWVFKVLSATKAQGIMKYVTGRSFVYSADIVAVTADGRAFKRVRIVVDARTLPSKVIYRRDLTSLGWPLPDSIRAALKAGQPPPVGLGAATSGLGF